MTCEIWGQLTHPIKLERDKGVDKLTEIFNGDDQAAKKELEAKFTEFARQPDDKWEAKLGFLLGSAILVEANASLEVPLFNNVALTMLVDEEVRVRQASAELLGVLCKVHGESVYEASRTTVLELIRVNIERDMQSGGGSKVGTAESIFHDTAGWKNLETSMYCLKVMVIGLGER